MSKLKVDFSINEVNVIEADEMTGYALHVCKSRCALLSNLVENASKVSVGFNKKQPGG